MNKEVVILAIAVLIEAGVAEHFYVRLTGKLVRFDGDGFVVSASGGMEVPIKKSSALEHPGLVTVDLRNGKKTINAATFEELLNRDISVNCFLDSEGAWRATDVYAKVKINQ